MPKDISRARARKGKAFFCKGPAQKAQSFFGRGRFSLKGGVRSGNLFGGVRRGNIF